MASPATPAPAIGGRTDNDRRMFGSLREIRASCQYLQAALVDDAPGATFGRIDQRVAAQLAAIRQVFGADPSEFEWCADTMAQVELSWARIHDLWPPDGTAQSVAGPRLKQIDKSLDEIVYHCVSLSLSPRINDVLSNLRTGQPLDIEFEFGEELPKDPALRRRLVLELAQESAVLTNGVVDVDQGVIYKAAATRQQQIWSVWRVLAWLLAGLLIPAGLAFGDRVLAGWPLHWADLERLLADYVLILIGSGAHLGVDALKAAKAKTRPSFQALNDWVLWVHVRESQIRNGIFYVFLGYILLAFGVPKLDWSSAFFAGYSIDSVTELFLERFQTAVKTRTQQLVAAAQA